MINDACKNKQHSKVNDDAFAARYARLLERERRKLQGFVNKSNEMKKSGLINEEQHKSNMEGAEVVKGYGRVVGEALKAIRKSAGPELERGGRRAATERVSMELDG